MTERQGAIMTLAEAQQDIRRSFVGGGPGVVVSGLVWLAAALVSEKAGIDTAFAALFLGGMLIFPLSVAIVRGVFRRAAPAKGAALTNVALESTIAMIAGLAGAYLLLAHDPRLVMPIAAMAVGTHYFAFATLYGDRLYWLLGALITAVGAVAIWGPIEIPYGPILAVAAIELAFGGLLTVKALAERQS
jgi:hypothetical protein